MSKSTAIPGTIPALGGALLLRRRPLRRLMQRAALAQRLPVLVTILLLSIFSIHFLSADSEFLTDRIFSAAGIALAQTAFWLIILFAIAEPVFDLLLCSATFDEAELHWWGRWRMTSRIGLLAAFVCSYLVYALSYAVFIKVSGGDVIAPAVAITWGFLILLMITKDWWNNVTSQALIIVSGPAFVIFTALFLLSYPWPFSLIVAIICLALAPVTMRDIVLRHRAHTAVESLAGDPKQDSGQWQEALELLHSSGDRDAAARLLDALHDDEAKHEGLSSWILVRLFSASGQFMEAIDAGLAALDREPASLPLHLAMAEACLGVRDAENAAAHAEEALDLAGGSASTEDGSEALLLLGLASYNQWETVSGMHACARVIDCAHHEPSPRLKRIIREARMIAGRFGTGTEEED